jgi:hypothetical protein
MKCQARAYKLHKQPMYVPILKIFNQSGPFHSITAVPYPNAYFTKAETSKT